MSCKTRPALLLLALAAAFTGLALPTGSARAAIFVVNSTEDDPDIVPGDGNCHTGQLTPLPGGGLVGECTLRAALEEANALLGQEVIRFAATLDGGSGLVEIVPTTPYPELTDETDIDGFSLPGYDENTPFATPVVGIDGRLLTGASGLVFRQGAEHSSVRGVALYGFVDAIDIGPGAAPGSGPSYIEIEGCHLGIRAGAHYPGNSGHGIRVQNTLWTKIGKQCGALGCLGQGNVIAASGQSGVYVSGTGTRIVGNRIGTDVAGSSLYGPFGDPTGNGQYGVDVEHGSGNVVGDEQPGGGNLVSGSRIAGIHIGESGNRVLGNYVGTNQAGTAVLGNQGPGVLVYGDDTEIGSLDGGGNLIAGNQDAGISNRGANPVRGNTVGLTADRSAAIGSQPIGIALLDDGTEVEGNFVGGSVDSDIFVHGLSHLLIDNYIGTNEYGDDFGGAAEGIRVTFGGDDVEIGAPDAGNVLGFHEDEIVLEAGSESGVIVGNWIGVHPNGTPMGAASEGIEVHGQNHRIGDIDGLSNGSANVIGFNFDGIEVFADAFDTFIQGNYIGTDASGADFGNLDNGIDISGATHTYVGAWLGAGDPVARRLGNVVAHNDGVGVSVTGAAAVENGIRGNAFFGNGFAAVDLYDNGPTANDALDADNGPNRVMNFPEFDLAGVAVQPGTGDLDVAFRVMTTVANAAFPLTVDFYLSTGNDGQPDVFFGSAQYDSGDATLWDLATIPAPPGVFPYGMLVASVTDANGNTSEFSNQFVPLPEPGSLAALLPGLGLLWALRRRGR